MSTPPTQPPKQPTSCPRVRLIKKAPTIKRNGVAAYGAVLKKCTPPFIPTHPTISHNHADTACPTDNIKPNLPGPFTMVEELLHGGEHYVPPLRWAAYQPQDKKAMTKRKLMQRNEAGTGLVEAKDVQNDTEYLVCVQWV